ncbi:CaiB/BaiF CoA transferase family protein [Georgenia alba]|uniref:CoA transferase n=1 Tax=Georgenia alba TaxID=2233858 RepID=A0ABW2Q3W3_9MICO
MSEQMQAAGAVLERIGGVGPWLASRPIVIPDVVLDPPRDGELLVRMEAAGSCHSAPSVVEGNRDRPLPCLMDNEAAGGQRGRRLVDNRLESEENAMSDTTAPRALEGMTVLDLSQVMAGPYCTMILGDYGAEVIKIENPEAGDQTRRSWGRLYAGQDSHAFLAMNRNKRSVALDLKDAEDLEKFYGLVRDADVVVENFRPGVAQRLGIDYDTLKDINPGLIYASISGFGLSGPYSTRPGYDLIAQAMSGVMSITGEPGGRPVKCGLPVSDLGAALFTAVGIVTAWAHKQRTGEGQKVETSLFESALALSVWESVEYWTTGRTPQPMGSGHRINEPYRALRTADGYVTVGANNQKLWRLLCRAMDDEALADDPRFATNMDRMDHLPELVEELERRLAARTSTEWVDIFLAAGVPAGPIQDYRQVLEEDEHVKARGMVTTVDHPLEGEVKLLASPIRMSGTPFTVRRHPPLLGEHTDEVVANLARTEA